MINETQLKSDLNLLDRQDNKIKMLLKEFMETNSQQKKLFGLAEAIADKLETEEKTMEKIGLCLTPVHRDEHKKLLREISLLEFSWKARRITDDIYIKSINYKLEFHDHYFDRTQRLLLLAEDRES
ncbi:MAG: hypothetical protein JXQ81_09500 [Desulfuromonadales bacterium]|nr:hypothetical protein [Desulfuromonadales bacterium]MBN2792728.1 hypothetical protein [Desulfuromonadales bacterium]